MAHACPVNFIQVDNTVSRITSALTATIVIVSVGFDLPWLLGLLLLDLLIRLYGSKRFSPLYHTAYRLKEILSLPSRSVDGASKKVAGHFGIVLIAVLMMALSLHWEHTAITIGIVFVTCLMMDLIFDFCIGCKVYYLYRFLSDEKRRSW